METDGNWILRKVLFDEDGIPLAHKDPYENELIELQKKAEAFDDLLRALVLARCVLEEYEQCYENQMFRNAQIDRAIAKAKGE